MAVLIQASTVSGKKSNRCFQGSIFPCFLPVTAWAERWLCWQLPCARRPWFTRSVRQKPGMPLLHCSLESTRIYRVENDHDLITTLPPAAVSFGFRHVGVPICLKDDLLTSLKSSSTRGWMDPPRFLSDHAPVNYTIRLENMMTRNFKPTTGGSSAVDKAGCEGIVGRCVQRGGGKLETGE